MDVLSLMTAPATTPSMSVALLLQHPANPLQNPLAPIILMVVIFYLVLFLPMRRRQRKAEAMLRDLKNGDRVLTSGGVMGTIVALGDDNTITLRIKPDNMKLQFSRSAVTALVNEGEEKK